MKQATFDDIAFDDADSPPSADPDDPDDESASSDDAEDAGPETDVDSETDESDVSEDVATTSDTDDTDGSGDGTTRETDEPAVADAADAVLLPVAAATSEGTDARPALDGEGGFSTLAVGFDRPCARCGEETGRRWRRDDSLVCPVCVEW